MEIDTITKHKVHIPVFSVQESLLCEISQSWHGLDSLNWLFIKHNSVIRQWSIKDSCCNCILDKKYGVNKKAHLNFKPS